MNEAVNRRDLRVLVCGGRDFKDRVLVHQVLGLLLPVCVITGGAEGADMLAFKWAEAMGKDRPRYYADWKSFGPKAGPMRNAKMLVEGKPDLVVAFAGGKGTEDLVRKAKRHGVPVFRVEPPIYATEGKV